MDKCNVCSKPYTMGKSSRNYSYEGFCSRYCHEYDRQNLSHKANKWPAIEVICQTCADPFSLIRQHNQYSHSHFCSIDCRKAMQNYDRKGERDYHYLLPVYQSTVGLTAADVSEKNKYRNNILYRTVIKQNITFFSLAKKISVCLVKKSVKFCKNSLWTTDSWNKLPIELRTSPNLNSFKQSLKLWIQTNITLT